MKCVAGPAVYSLLLLGPQPQAPGAGSFPHSFSTKFMTFTTTWLAMCFHSLLQIKSAFGSPAETLLVSRWPRPGNNANELGEHGQPWAEG